LYCFAKSNSTVICVDADHGYVWPIDKVFSWAPRGLGVPKPYPRLDAGLERTEEVARHDMCLAAFSFIHTFSKPSFKFICTCPETNEFMISNSLTRILLLRQYDAIKPTQQSITFVPYPELRGRGRGSQSHPLIPNEHQVRPSRTDGGLKRHYIYTFSKQLIYLDIYIHFHMSGNERVHGLEWFDVRSWSSADHFQLESSASLLF
jgi:hypothetical protein